MPETIVGSVIFGVSSTGSQIPFNLNIPMLLVIFYLLSFLCIFVNIQMNPYLDKKKLAPLE